MVVTCVHVLVKRENIDDFIDATRKNHKESVKEPGNLRFDVLQDLDDPSRFLIYEAYESDEAASEHKKTPHYLAWRETVADWMDQPRKGIKHRVICPSDIEKW
jgi:autoinducer 2-degrading protein